MLSSWRLLLGTSIYCPHPQAQVPRASQPMRLGGLSGVFLRLSRDGVSSNRTVIMQPLSGVTAGFAAL